MTSHLFDIAHMPSHTHAVVDPGHDHLFAMPYGDTPRLHFRDSSTDRDDDSLPVYARYSGDVLALQKAKTGITQVEPMGGGDGRITLLPPYYALCFIQKR